MPSMNDKPPITIIDHALINRVLSANPRVRRLNLSYNAITDTADKDYTNDRLDRTDVFEFIGLRLHYLNLSYNKLVRLSDSFGYLVALQALDLSHNELEDISALRTLTNLRTLDVSFNRLRTWDTLACLVNYSSPIDDSQGIRSDRNVPRTSNENTATDESSSQPTFDPLSSSVSSSSSSVSATASVPTGKLRESLTSLKLEGNPVLQTLPKDQYELYVRSLFPRIERIDDLPETSRGTTISSKEGNSDGTSSRSNASVTSSSARTVHIHTVPNEHLPGYGNEKIHPEPSSSSSTSDDVTVPAPFVSSPRSNSPLQEKISSLATKLGTHTHISSSSPRSSSPLALSSSSPRWSSSNPSVEAVTAAAVTALELIEEVRSRASSRLSRSSTPPPLPSSSSLTTSAPLTVVASVTVTNPENEKDTIPSTVTTATTTDIRTQLDATVPSVPPSTTATVPFDLPAPTPVIPPLSITPPTNIANKTPARPISLTSPNNVTDTMNPPLIAPPSPRSITGGDDPDQDSPIVPSSSLSSAPHAPPYLGLPSTLTASSLPPLVPVSTGISSKTSTLPSSTSVRITPARPLSLSSAPTDPVPAKESFPSSDNHTLPPSSIPSCISSAYPTPQRPGYSSSSSVTGGSVLSIPLSTTALPYLSRIRHDGSHTNTNSYPLTDTERHEYETRIHLLQAKLQAQERILTEYETSLSTARAAVVNAQPQGHTDHAHEESAEDTSDNDDEEENTSVASHGTDHTPSTASSSSSCSSTSSSSSDHTSHSLPPTLSNDLRTQALAYAHALSAVRQQYTDLQTHYQQTQNQEQEMYQSYQLRLQELTYALTQSETTKSLYEEEIKHLKTLIQSQTQSYQTELGNLRELTYQSTNEISTILIQRDNAVRDNERLNRTLILNQQTIESLTSDMENLRLRHNQEITRLHSQLSRLTAGEEGRVTTMVDELTSVQVENTELKLQCTKHEHMLTVLGNRLEQTEQRLNDTSVLLQQTEQQVTSLKFTVQETLHQRNTLTNLIVTTIQPFIHSFTQKLEALQAITNDALTQLTLRLQFVIDVYRNRTLTTVIDQYTVQRLYDVLQNERKVWEEALGNQAQRKLDQYKIETQIVFGLYLLHTQRERRDEEDTEKDTNDQNRNSSSSSVPLPLPSFLTLPDDLTSFVQEVYTNRPLTIAATESYLTNLHLQYESLLANHEEEIQEGANVLSTAYETTDTLMHALLQQMKVSTDTEEGKQGSSLTLYGTVGNVSNDVTSPSTTSLSTEALSLLSAEALKDRLIRSYEELTMFKQRLTTLIETRTSQETAFTASANYHLHELKKENEQLRQEREGLWTKLTQLNEERTKEQEEHTQTIAKMDAARIRQLTTAKDATLRARSQVAQLETALETERNQHNTAAADARRLERELVRLTERHTEIHKKALDEYTESLVKVRTEFETLKKEYEYSQNIANTVPRLKETIDELQKERNALIATLASMQEGTVPVRTKTFLTNTEVGREENSAGNGNEKHPGTVVKEPTESTASIVSSMPLVSPTITNNHSNTGSTTMNVTDTPFVVSTLPGATVVPLPKPSLSSTMITVNGAVTGMNRPLPRPLPMDGNE